MTVNDGFFAALDAVEREVAADAADPAIDPRCAAFVLHHGRSAQRAFLLFHGFTNCPRQFATFAQLLFAAGSNVYVPRLPRHGLRDKLTPELANLTSDELQTFSDRSAGLAAGLGAELSVVGLSVGATLAAWLAQTRSIDRVLAVAPFFSVVRIPSLLEPAFAGGLDLVPNVEVWWDPRVRENAAPDHAYPRFATHALAQCLKFGQQIREAASATGARAALSILALNAKDPAIDGGAARAVWERWRSHGSATVQFTFENLDARHDIIEPVTYPDAARLVYPVLMQLLAR